MKDCQFYIFVRSFSQTSLAPGLFSTYTEEQNCAGKGVQCPAEELLALLDPPPHIIKFSGHSVNSNGKKSMARPLLLCVYLGGSES